MRTLWWLDLTGFAGATVFAAFISISPLARSSVSFYPMVGCIALGWVCLVLAR